MTFCLHSADRNTQLHSNGGCVPPSATKNWRPRKWKHITMKHTRRWWFVVPHAFEHSASSCIICVASYVKRYCVVLSLPASFDAPHSSWQDNVCNLTPSAQGTRDTNHVQSYHRCIGSLRLLCVSFVSIRSLVVVGRKSHCRVDRTIVATYLINNGSKTTDRSFDRCRANETGAKGVYATVRSNAIYALSVWFTDILSSNGAIYQPLSRKMHGYGSSNHLMSPLGSPQPQNRSQMRTNGHFSSIYQVSIGV